MSALPLYSVRGGFGNTENRYHCLGVTVKAFKVAILSAAQSVRMRRVFLSTKRTQCLPVGWQGPFGQVASESFSASRNLQTLASIVIFNEAA